MKKVWVLILALCTCVSLCACQNGDYQKALESFAAGKYADAQVLFASLGDYEDSKELAKKSGYLLGKEMMSEGKYDQAIEMFKNLGSYEDCESLVAACELTEIDAMLQGTWKNVQYESIVTEGTFDRGRYTTKLSAGTSSIGNEGSYRIDHEEQAIYICYDYIINANGSKTPNKEEKQLFVYELENGALKLYNDSKELVYVKQ